MNTRRDLLAASAKVAVLLAGAGLLPGVATAQTSPWNRGAFDAKTMAELAKALGTGMPAVSKDVTVSGPDIAENGAFVPIAVATTLPNAKRLLILVEKNPNLLSAIFDVTESVEPSFSIRLKMAQSSDVYAVALTGDNRIFYAKKDVRVTLGGCAG